MTATELKQNKYIYNADFEISDLEKEYVSLSNNEGGKIEIQLENRIDLRALNKAIVDAADNCIPRILVHTKNEIKDNKNHYIIKSISLEVIDMRPSAPWIQKSKKGIMFTTEILK